MIEVHFCCNDEYGNLTGRLCAVEFWRHGDMLARLESDDVEGVPFDVPAIRSRFVGNICWDAIEIDQVKAIAMARSLVQQGFSVIEHVTDEWPWNSLDGRP